MGRVKDKAQEMQEFRDDIAMAEWLAKREEEEAYKIGYEEGLIGNNPKQVGGSHYADMVITPTQYILANNIPWLEANAIKYISRHTKKNGVEDIDKAIHYLELVKERYYTKETNEYK